MSNQAGRISQEILGSSQGHFQIMIHFYIYTMRYSFHLKGFIREVFRYCQIGPSWLHLNRQITLSTFDKCCRLIGNEPKVNVFRNCYHLVVDTDGGNEVHCFFTFINRPTRAMKGTLKGKLVHVKKWRERQLNVRYRGLVNPRGEIQQVWGCLYY